MRFPNHGKILFNNKNEKRPLEMGLGVVAMAVPLCIDINTQLSRLLSTTVEAKMIKLVPGTTEE